MRVIPAANGRTNRSRRGTLTVVTGIRIVVGVIITAIVAVALVPMLVLLDLVAGGNGWGLCGEGITSCATSYFDGPELAAGLLLMIFLLLVLLRMALHVQRIILSRRSRQPVARSAVRADEFRG